MDDRQRCLKSGCNPYLKDKEEAFKHKEETGHRVAKWPVRSEEGKRRAELRNKTGYYDKYNKGSKSAVARGIVGPPMIPVGDPDGNVVGGFSPEGYELTERDIEQIEEYGSTEYDDWQDAFNYEAEYDRRTGSF